MQYNIKIISALYHSDYKLTIFFNDGTENTFDYKNFVTSGHEEFTPYLNVIKFKKFKVVNSKKAIAWGKEWNMILPIDILYRKKYIRI